MTPQYLTRVQENGAITLSDFALAILGVQEGDEVEITAMGIGAVITSRSMMERNDIDETKRLLSEAGWSLEELIESGRETRGERLRELYGIEDSSGA